MANKKSAKQEILVNKRNRQRNVHYKSLMRNAYKKALSAIESKDKEVTTIVRRTLQILDKVASKGIIHKNFSARKKSSLAKKLNTLSK
tara:strand:+ start:742 stop:1005 length:264 start_codon:yes stop_codon:yes gene_type:complete